MPERRNFRARSEFFPHDRQSITEAKMRFPPIESASRLCRVKHMQPYPTYVFGALGGAILVFLAAPASFCEQETAQGAISGVIEQVDVKARSITVKLELESKTFQVAKDAKIFKKKEDKGSVSDEQGTLADLKV